MTEEYIERREARETRGDQATDGMIHKELLRDIEGNIYFAEEKNPDEIIPESPSP